MMWMMFGREGSSMSAWLLAAKEEATGIRVAMQKIVVRLIEVGLVANTGESINRNRFLYKFFSWYRRLS